MKFQKELFLFLFASSVLFEPTALATPTESRTQTLNYDYRTPSPQSVTSLELNQSQYLGTATNTSQDLSTSSASLHWRHASGDVWKKKAETYGEFYFNEVGRPYVAVPELYTEARFFDRWAFIHIGRKLEPWSRGDDHWKLGLWQSLARWDYFRPESQGLIGLGTGVSQKNWGWEVLVSPFFVPDQGPQFQLVDGRFESNNRWFWEPQTEVDLFSDTSNIYYRLETPSNEEVVMQATYATRLWAGEYKKTPWISLAYAYKPVNQLHLAVEPRYDHSTEEVVATVFPSVVRHHIATLESGVGNEKAHFWISASREWPEKPEYPSDYLQTPLDEAFYASSGFEHALNFGPFKYSKVQWSYLKIWTLNSSPSGSSLVSDVQSSYSRFPIEEVAAVEWSSRFLNKAHSQLQGRFKYWYSVPEDGSWVSAGIDWKTSPQWLWRLDVDVLGVNTEETDNSGLVGRYRTNDRIVLGASYVF